MQHGRYDVTVLCAAWASCTAFTTFSTEGLNIKNFLATTLPSTATLSSPRLPLTTSTSTPGSFRSASATRAACSLVPPHTGHSRIVTFVMALLLTNTFRATIFIVTRPQLKSGFRRGGSARYGLKVDRSLRERVIIDDLLVGD